MSSYHLTRVLMTSVHCIQIVIKDCNFSKKKYHINWKFHSMKHQKYHLNWTQIHLVYDRRRKYILKVSSIIEYIKTHLWWNRFNVFSDANPQKLILTTQTILKRNYLLYLDKNKFIMNLILPYYTKFFLIFRFMYQLGNRIFWSHYFSN